MAVSNTTTRMTATGTWTRVYDPQAASDFDFTVENFETTTATVQLAIAARGATVADTDAFHKETLGQNDFIAGGKVLLESGQALFVKNTGADLRILIIAQEG
jgi:hypothetical protein